MAEYKNRIALIIPTRNRPGLLVKTLRSLERQTVRPHQLIVVDGSDEPLENMVRSRAGIQFEYIRVFPPGLTRQRNAGLAALQSGITLAGYLDDDVEVYPDAVERMLDFWEKADEKTGGASFNIVNNPEEKRSIILRLFNIWSPRPGRVLRSGFVTFAGKIDLNLQTEWLCGGATVWKRSLFEKEKYDEWFKGTASIEDVDFSFRIGKTHRLFVVSDARLDHNPPPYVEKNAYHYGRMQAMYRFYFVKKHFGAGAYPAWGWAMLGKILGGVLSLKRINIIRAAGFVSGVWSVLTGRLGGVHQNFR